jgi:hypothetical protein
MLLSYYNVSNKETICVSSCYLLNVVGLLCRNSLEIFQIILFACGVALERLILDKAL